MEEGNFWCAECCKKNGTSVKKNMALLIQQCAKALAAFWGDESVPLACAEGPATCSKCGKTFWISSRY